MATAPADAPPGTGNDQGTLLAAAVDTASTRLCLLESIRGVYRLAAWSHHARQGERHLGDQLAAACRRLGRRLGRRLWDEDAHAPLLTSSDPIRRPPVAHLALTLNPLPPLRIWLFGLSDGFSLAAAHQAATACNVTVVGSTVLSIGPIAENLGQALFDSRPDVLLLVGGYDQADPLSLQPLAILGAVAGNALLTLPPALRPALFFAGNRWATPHLQSLMSQIDVALVAVPNVMPAPGVIRQATLVRAWDEYAAHLAQRVDGYRLLTQWHTGPAAIATVESNFIRLVLTWRSLHNLTDLHAVYLGARRVHVWSAEGRDGPMILTAEAGDNLKTPGPNVPHGWPPLQLVSGPWTERTLPDTTSWWDREGLAPVVAALGPVAPVAVYQTLTNDLLRSPD